MIGPESALRAAVAALSSSVGSASGVMAGDLSPIPLLGILLEYRGTEQVQVTARWHYPR